MMRLALLKIAGAAGSLAACVGMLYGVLTLPLPEYRFAVLALFPLAMGLSLAVGWMLGGVLWSLLRGERSFFVLLPAQVLLAGGSVFCLLGCFAGHPVTQHPAGQAGMIVAAFVLLVASGYVLGRVLLPSGAALPMRRRGFVPLLLYGSAVGGGIVHHAFPLPWGKVPPFQEGIPRRTYPRATLEKIRSRFPPKVVVSRRGNGDTEYDCIYPERPPRLSVISCEDSVVADENEIVLEEGRIRLLGHAMYHSDGLFRYRGLPRWCDEQVWADRPMVRKGEDGRAESPTRLVGFWRTNGTAVEEESWPDPGGFHLYGYVCGGFLVEVEGPLRPVTQGEHDLVLRPWETPLGHPGRKRILSGKADGESQRVMLDYSFHLPIPGPLELRLLIPREGEREYSMSCKPGEVLHLERNGIQLIESLKGSFLVLSSDMFPSGELLLRPPEKPVEAPRTTVTFAMAFHEDIPSRIRIEALRGNGRLIDRTDSTVWSHYLLAEFACEPEEIAGFRVFEKPVPLQARFPISDIPVFPPENRNADSLLDLRIPYANSLDDLFFCPTLITRFEPRIGALLAPGVHKMKVRGARLRDALDRRHPGGWYVENGRLIVQYSPPVNLPTRLRGAIGIE